MLKTLHITVIALCIAIAAWGLQYKLSLYETLPTSSIPAAKLLTGKMSASIEASQDRHPSDPQTEIAPFLLLLIALRSVATKITQLPASVSGTRDMRDLSRAVLSRFSFRPPPAFA